MFAYTVNARPVIELTDSQPVVLMVGDGQGVVLPIAVSDDNGDAVRVFYRFQGEGEEEEEPWAVVPVGKDGHVLAAERFDGHLDGGVVELFAWDGLEKSANVLKVPYAARAAGGAVGQQEGGDGDSELAELPVDSIAVGLVIGGVGLVALAIGIAIFATRTRAAKTESSSGLLDEE